MDTQLEQPSFIEKGVAHVFRESEGRGHGKFFWGLRPQTPSCFLNRSENLPGSAPEETPYSKFDSYKSISLMTKFLASCGKNAFMTDCVQVEGLFSMEFIWNQISEC